MTTSASAHNAHRLDAAAVALYVHSPMADVMTHTASTWRYVGENEVRAHAARASTDGRKLEVVLTAGNPVEELVRVGDERDARMLVVGRRGRGAVRGLFLGRVPAQLLHHANRPVAIIPHY